MADLGQLSRNPSVYTHKRVALMLPLCDLGTHTADALSCFSMHTHAHTSYKRVKKNYFTFASISYMHFKVLLKDTDRKPNASYVSTFFSKTPRPTHIHTHPHRNTLLYDSASYHQLLSFITHEELMDPVPESCTFPHCCLGIFMSASTFVPVLPR